MEASTGLFAGSPNSKELVAIQGPDEVITFFIIIR